MDCNKDHVVLQTGEIVERRTECLDLTCNVGKHPGCWRTVSPAIYARCERYRTALNEILREAKSPNMPLKSIEYIVEFAERALQEPGKAQP
jgi:hypothetical protein